MTREMMVQSASFEKNHKHFLFGSEISFDILHKKMFLRTKLLAHSNFQDLLLKFTCHN